MHFGVGRSEYSVNQANARVIEEYLLRMESKEQNRKRGGEWQVSQAEEERVVIIGGSKPRRLSFVDRCIRDIKVMSWNEEECLLLICYEAGGQMKLLRVECSGCRVNKVEEFPKLLMGALKYVVGAGELVLYSRKEMLVIDTVRQARRVHLLLQHHENIDRVYYSAGSMFIVVDGTVFAWGDNSLGQLGLLIKGRYQVPQKVYVNRGKRVDVRDAVFGQRQTYLICKEELYGCRLANRQNELNFEGLLPIKGKDECVNPLNQPYATILRRILNDRNIGLDALELLRNCEQEALMQTCGRDTWITLRSRMVWIDEREVRILNCTGSIHISRNQFGVAVVCTGREADSVVSFITTKSVHRCLRCLRCAQLEKNNHQQQQIIRLQENLIEQLTRKIGREEVENGVENADSADSADSADNDKTIRQSLQRLRALLQGSL